MRRSMALAVFWVLGFVLYLQIVGTSELHDSNFINPSGLCLDGPSARIKNCTDSLLPNMLLAKDNGKSNGGKATVGNGNKSDKPDLRYVDWSKPNAVKKDEVNGNGNGNGQDGEDKDKEDEGDKEDDKGFDRLWDVILYG